MIRRAAACVLAAGGLALPAAAGCRLALVLAMDVSNSVNATEDALQRSGLAAALASDVVQQAVFATDQHVAIAAFEWSGRHHQQVMLNWTVLDEPADLFAAAQGIADSRRGQIDFPTAMGHALTFGARMFETAPPCLFQTIDVAGDGRSNTGYDPQIAFADPRFDRITVNGLVVRVLDLGMDLGVPAWYETHVKHGPGAFIEVAQGFGDYERAMTRKLQRELAPAVLGGQVQTGPAG